MNVALLASHKSKSMRFNVNDIVVLIIIFASIWLFAYGWHDMHANFNGENLKPISLNYHELPYYTLRTTMRLVIGMVYSMLFSVVFAVLAAKYAPMRRVILPFVNFMESVPLVGFLTFTTVYFLGLYPHSVLGLECAAIFAVFTGQAWNMMLTLYQTLRIVPGELNEATHMFRYNPWQRFWRLEFLYSVPGLLWNTMVSQSAAWFALIGSEAIPVTDNNTVNLPGVGAYMAQALAEGNSHAILYAVIALILNIIILDQLFFRPLVRYSHRFKYEDLPSQKVDSSWFYNCLSRSATGQVLGRCCRLLADFWLFSLPKIWYLFRINVITRLCAKLNHFWSSLWYVVVVVACVYYGYQLWEFFPKQYLSSLPQWMGLTAARVLVAMLASIIIFTPLGVWIGLNPRLVKFCQPIIQVMAAVPASIFYPFIAIFIVTFHQNLSWWAIPMIMLGTQWYVLFNVIAGTSTLPTQIIEASKIFHVRGLMWWRKFILPAIFPYIVTGIISAAGGAWNTAIASELLEWGKISLTTTGLGSFIARTTGAGQNAEAALGCTAMCVMVAVCIIFIWQPLYRYAETKFKFD